MKKENVVISLETLEFLVRHPWCFVYPFVIILCMTAAYVSVTPKTYECEAIVSFGTISGEKSAQRTENLIAKTYFGDNIKEIIKSVWPALSEEKNPLRYTMLMNALRNPRGGIMIQFDRRDQTLAHISFKSSTPAISYAVVQATINVIKLENVRTMQESIESSITFLTRQLNFYKDKIATIDSEMLKVSTKLREMAVGLNIEQRELVYRMTSEWFLQQGNNDRPMMGDARNTDILAELDMKLVEAKKNKKMLEMRIEKKDFTPVQSESQDKKEDVFKKAIEERKMAIFDLKSRGALPDHPEVKRLEKAVKDLEALREKEAAGGKESELSENEKKFIERKLKDDLVELNYTIETLEEKKAILEQYKKASASAPAAEEALVGPVAAEATKLKALRDEREVMVRYYNDLRKQLEDADLRSRAEKARAGFIIDIVEPPKAPITPLQSQKSGKLFLGLIIAIGAGSALSYLVDSMDKSIRSASELRNKFHIPVIASIDRIYTAADVKSRRERRNMIIISMMATAVLAMIATRVAALIFGVI
jgi:hypothetical protein